MEITDDFPREYRYCQLTFAEQSILFDDDGPSRYLQQYHGTIECSGQVFSDTPIGH